MTATPTPQTPIRLRAVTPAAQPSSSHVPEPTKQEKAERAGSTKPRQGSGRRGWMAAGGAIALASLSFIPLPHRVTGPGEVAATQNAFEKISMPASGGTIQEVFVTTNEPVTANAVVARLKIDSLEGQLAQARQEATQSLALLESRRQQINLRQGELNETSAQVATAQQEVDRLQAELSSGTPPAVQGWRGEISALEAEIVGLQEERETLSQRMAKARPALEAGAIAQIEFDGWQVQRTQLQNQIVSKQGQIAAKQAQIDSFYQDKQGALTQAKGALAERQATLQAVTQARQSAVEEHQAQQQLVDQQREEVVRQQTQLADYEVLRTTIAGTIITTQQEIDALRGRFLEPGQPILEVMNPDELTVDVWVRQEDRNLVQEGMAAEFRPQSGQWERYPAVVATVSARTEFNEAAQKPMIRVTLRLEQADSGLQLNTTGTARIQTGSLPVYAKVSREFLKVVPLQKLWAF
ncbi:MAG: HlyD family efflux transporter periplasmic adaptor subunit [Leptolyngbya sp. SIO4C5]|nr:HlyD family efflux transporter periplasmic adaptor subunit [Leptolyngbya sp. SIO4C5]